MRGKEPKERERYFIRLGDGTLVEVGREVYLEWHRSGRRERYQKERDKKYGVCSLEGLEEKGCFPEKPACADDVTQEAALRNICADKLWDAIRKQPEQDIRLVRLLFFEETTVREAAEVFGCSRKAIGCRKQKILEKIRRELFAF